MSDDKESWFDKTSNRLYLWGGILSTVVGISVGSYFIGTSVGANKGILDLPAKIDAVQAALELKITASQTAMELKNEASQAKDSEALKTQVKINEDLVRQLSELKSDIKTEAQVNANTDKYQWDNITRLEGLINDMRKIMK